MKQFGEKVEGYDIPVLNEREIRASSGMLFVFAFLSLIRIICVKDFLFAKYFITYFFIEFCIRIFLSPRFAPSLIIGRWIVNGQRPEYVGAPQKKYAWNIGFILSGIMFLLMVVMNTASIITGLICLICLIFLFFESVFGICLGCTFYKWHYKQKAQYCPGDVCENPIKSDIQRISKSQLVFLLSCIVLIPLLFYFSHDVLNTPIENLWVKLHLKH